MKLPTLVRTGVFQATLAYVLLFGVSVTALVILIYWSVTGSLERQSDAVTEAEIRGLAEQYDRRGLVGLVDVIRERVRRDGGGRSVYLLVDATLRPLAGNVAFWPRQFNRRGEWVDFTKTDTSGNQAPARALVLPVGQGYRLMVGRENPELVQIKQVFRRVAIWGIGLTMGLALIGGLMLALQAEKKIARLNRTTREIIAGDLSRRVPTSGSRDEYEELTKNVNTMLDRIESLLAGIRHVGDSIAHDLRSPLTRLRNQLESLAAEEHAKPETLEQCARQAEGLLATFNALLRIARIESGAYRSAFAVVDLSAIVRDVCELYQAAAEAREISLDCETVGPAHVFGDRELLAQALTNLLDNAIKYTPDRGKITVELVRRGEALQVSVADSGPGIPSDQRERIFERFARLDQSRSKPGNGLGLSLVRAVAEQHDGRISVEDNSPGLKIKLALPSVPSQTADRGAISF